MENNQDLLVREVTNSIHSTLCASIPPYLPGPPSEGLVPRLMPTRGGHSHIPLVIALPVVKVKSRVKGHFLTLHLGSNGTFNNCNITDCNSTCVVKGSRSQFWHSHRVKSSNGGSKLLTDGHGRDCSIYGSDHPV